MSLGAQVAFEQQMLPRAPAAALSRRWCERRGDTDDDTAFSPSASVSAPGEGQDLDSSAHDAVRSRAPAASCGPVQPSC